MRIFTSFGLAGLIWAAIWAFQLHGFIEVGTWRSTVVSAVKSWQSSRFIEGRCQDWQLCRKACTWNRAASGWDILYHVGGNGPWIQKVDGTLGESIEPPVGCKVEQVHMVSTISGSLSLP